MVLLISNENLHHVNGACKLFEITGHICAQKGEVVGSMLPKNIKKCILCKFTKGIEIHLLFFIDDIDAYLFYIFHRSSLSTA